MALFQCIRSGNTVEFNGAYDIKQMRLQILDYREVKLDSEGNIVLVETETVDPDIRKPNKPKQRKYTGHPVEAE